MDRREYTKRVLACLHRVTEAERAAIRAEIDAHMEDHICALLDLGYDEALAEERTMRLMGDPEEVGRELDLQYAPRVWGILEGTALLMLMALLLQAVLGVGILFHARDYVLARFVPERKLEQSSANQGFETETYEDSDIRIRVGNDVLRVYRVSVGERPDLSHTAEPGDMIWAARVSLCAYDRIPFGVVAGDIHKGLTLENQRGEVLDSWTAGGEGTGSYGAEYMSRYAAIEPGDTHVTLIYDRFGETASVDIPLPEVTP